MRGSHAFAAWYDELPTIDEVHITVEHLDEGEDLPAGMAHTGPCCPDLMDGAPGSASALWAQRHGIEHW